MCEFLPSAAHRVPKEAIGKKESEEIEWMAHDRSEDLADAREFPGILTLNECKSVLGEVSQKRCCTGANLRLFYGLRAGNLLD